jgi:CubicO group peptidase (beta-lactamase class C family)
MMKIFLCLGIFVALVLSSSISNMQIVTAQTNSANQLTGLWAAKKRFGPDIRGTLLLRQTGGAWRAEIAGRSADAKTSGEAVSFELADGLGSFEGKFDARRENISGLWVQQRTLEGGYRYAQAVTLNRFGNGVWRGTVTPYEDALTFYLSVKPRDDGSLGAFLRNPERNLGWLQFRADRIEREGNSLKLYAADKGTEKGRLLAEGAYDADAEVITFYFQNRGGTYDFRRVGADETSDFYPRGRPTAAYVYQKPPQLDDGWQTASLEDVGISRAAIEKFVQMMVNTPIDVANAQEDHGILIARHGKLVLEEYFHGESRDKPHETRSASKSVASDLAGALMQTGVSLKTSDFVYQLMNGGAFPENLEPRKRAMTFEHLLTMSSGFDCDEGNPKSQGFEDNMWEQTDEPNFYKWTLDLKMVREPGEKAIYCSAGANLVGGIVARTAKQSAQNLFQKLLGEPLQMKRYYLPLSPAGEYSLTGGSKFLPRDFMKLGQVHLNGGTWNGRRIFSSEWSRRATSVLYYLDAYKQSYGYLWWSVEYPYKDRKVRAYFAAGNGGQIVMVVEELDLVMAFYAGNYNDTGGKKAQNIYVPQYILPAIEN